MLCPLKYNNLDVISLLFGMIEIDMLKDCVFYNDWETTNCAPWLSWMEEHVYMPGERIKTIKRRKMKGCPGDGAKALITL